MITMFICVQSQCSYIVEHFILRHFTPQPTYLNALPTLPISSFLIAEERRKNVLGIFGGSKSIDGRAASEAEQGHGHGPEGGARGVSMSSVGGHGRVTEEKVSCFARIL